MTIQTIVCWIISTVYFCAILLFSGLLLLLRLPMQLHVSVERLPFGKPFRTVVALMRPLSAVRPPMTFQIRCLRKRLRTLIAPVVAFAGVNLGVHPQRARLGERFAAHFARIRQIAVVAVGVELLFRFRIRHCKLRY